MDRTIMFPGQLVSTEQLLQMQVDTLKAVAALGAATMGQLIVDGMACAPGTGLTVSVAAGSIMAYEEIDATPFGVLGTDTLVVPQFAVNASPAALATPAPTTVGQSINYLIEAEWVTQDTNSVVLQFYNPAVPSLPYTGQNNDGAPLNTRRIQYVNLVAKAGAPATTGTQTTPSVDTNFVPLYVVTVPYGATSLTTGEIAVASGAPFLPIKLPQCVAAGGRKLGAPYYLSGSGTFTPQNAGCLAVALSGQGGGGAGGGVPSTTSGPNAAAGGGGGEGAYGELYLTSGFSGASYSIGAAGSGVSGSNGGAGGNAVFGSYTFHGGAGGLVGAATSQGITNSVFGGAAPTGSAITKQRSGDIGAVGLVMSAALAVGGHGGGLGGGGNQTSTGAGDNALSLGAGGGGAVSINGAAQAGGNGGAPWILVQETG